MSSLQPEKQHPAKSFDETAFENKVLRTMIDGSEAGIYVTDFHTGEILYVNRKTLSLFQSSHQASDLVGKNCWDIINGEGRGRCAFCPYKKLLDENGIPLKAYSWEHLFSEYKIWLKISSQAIQWADGRMAQINTFYDVTKEKRMQRRLTALALEKEKRRGQQELLGIMDAMPVSVTIMNFDDGEIIYINKAGLKLFNCQSEDDLKGRTGFSFMPDVQPNGQKTRDMIEKVSHLEGSQGVFRFFKLTGEAFDARVTSCSIDYKGTRASLSVQEDLTAQQELERTLQVAAEREREANSLKSRFLSDMSHEIRTPMNAIIGLTDIALYNHQPAESMEIFEKINGSAKSLLQIINDILDFSKIEADKLEIHPEEFELDEVLTNVSMVAASRLDGKDIEFMLNIALDLPRFLIGDKTRLWQILKNHLDNSAKYTRQGSIILTLTEDKKHSTEDTICLVFTIDDTGIGMSEDDLARALLPYAQIHNDIQTKYSGSGLGMSISKRLCDLMGGQFDIASQINQGTVVRISIPFARSERTDTERWALDCNGLSDLKVLIADDNGLSRQIITNLLVNCGAECVAVTSGAEALETIGTCPEEAPAFDVILLDYQMPELDGLQTARKIRERTGQKYKLMMITAFKHLLREKEVFGAGIDCLLEKPFVPSGFLKAVMKTVGMECVPMKPPAYQYVSFSETRILVCEDNDLNQEVTVRMLEQFGVTADVAENGAVAVEKLERGERFDLILMDLHMPVMDGYRASEAIRSHSEFDGMPIICLTADAMAEVMNRCLEFGMDDYLAKPISITDMHKILVKWIPVCKQISENEQSSAG